jgi:phenylalanyl-tRNA synthetase alpha chain
MENLEGLAAEAAAKISAATDAQALDQVRVEYLGKKGHITALLKGLGSLSAEERPAAGAEINRVKEALSDQISESKQRLDQAAVDARLEAEKNRRYFIWSRSTCRWIASSNANHRADQRIFRRHWI